MKEVVFSKVGVGETFFIKTEDYNRISQCEKLTPTSAKEIFGGELTFEEQDLVIVE